MSLLASNDRVVFLGQGVRYKGTFMSLTLDHIDPVKRVELPVMEEAQLGMSIGMSLAGFIPVSIFPRWNFFVLATNQAVNHLDKMKPHVIVRVGVGSTQPLDPGDQHKGNFADAFRLMMPSTPIVELDHVDKIIPGYRFALNHKGPSILVEYADSYAN